MGNAEDRQITRPNAIVGGNLQVGMLIHQSGNDPMCRCGLRRDASGPQMQRRNGQLRVKGCVPFTKAHNCFICLRNRLHVCPDLQSRLEPCAVIRPSFRLWA